MRRLLIAGALLSFSARAQQPLPPANAAAAAMQPHPKFEWDVPDVLEAVEVPATVEANGIPVHIRAVRSSWKIERLIQYMGDRFEKAHLYMLLPEQQIQIMKEVQITAYDWRTRVSYTVFFQPNRDGSTTLIMGEAALGQRKKDQAADFAPLMPNAVAPVRSNSDELQTLTYSVAGKPSDVESFYKQTLGTAGYLEEKEGVFQNPARQDQIRLRTHHEKNGEVSVLLLHQRGGSQTALNP